MPVSSSTTSWLGENKKIAYAAGLVGQKIVPIQLITMLASSFVGVVTLVLYVEVKPLLAYLAATIFAGFWRIFSEFFRNDYRGGGKVSAYQVISGFSIVYALKPRREGSLFPYMRSATYHVRPGTNIQLFSKQTYCQ